MKRISNTQYCEGIASFVVLTDMLGSALRDALPGIRLKKISAYAWRGYQIKKYPGLKESQYYWLVYHGHPDILVFQEYFEMDNYPYKMEFDLRAQGFFTESYDNQKLILTYFIRQSIIEAISWNNSDRRHQEVYEKRW